MRQEHFRQQALTRNSHVIHVTETTRFRLFRVVKTASPVDRNVRVARVELFCRSWILAGPNGLYSPSEPPAEMVQNS